jgi:hypothetical protein
MPDSPIIKGLIFLTDKLMSCLGILGKTKRDQRDRIAAYCDSVADTLSQASQSLEKGIIPHGLCSQLDQYMHDLKDVLQQSLPEDEFGELHDVLAVAYQVEHIDRELPPPTRRGSKYAELDIAAGKFRAIAQAVKATKSRRRR